MDINKLFRLAGQKEGKPLSYKKLRDIYKLLNTYTYEERMKTLGLKPDRADVIIPAAKIYMSVMKWDRAPRPATFLVPAPSICQQTRTQRVQRMQRLWSIPNRLWVRSMSHLGD